MIRRSELYGLSRVIYLGFDKELCDRAVAAHEGFVPTERFKEWLIWFKSQPYCMELADIGTWYYNAVIERQGRESTRGK